MARVLSTKWWNVCRRELRASLVTYEGDPPSCPDCYGEMHLKEGKFGRFYGCGEFFCQGTHGARLDGTPRKLKLSPETNEAWEQTRKAIRQYLDAWALHSLAFEPRTTFMLEDVVNNGPCFEALEKRLTWDGLFLNLPPTNLWTKYQKGLHLRKRSQAELAVIRQAAISLRSELVSGSFFARLTGDHIIETG